MSEVREAYHQTRSLLEEAVKAVPSPETKEDIYFTFDAALRFLEESPDVLGQTFDFVNRDEGGIRFFWLLKEAIQKPSTDEIQLRAIQALANLTVHNSDWLTTTDDISFLIRMTLPRGSTTDTCRPEVRAEALTGFTNLVSDKDFKAERAHLEQIFFFFFKPTVEDFRLNAVFGSKNATISGRDSFKRLVLANASLVMCHDKNEAVVLNAIKCVHRLVAESDDKNLKIAAGDIIRDNIKRHSNPEILNAMEQVLEIDLSTKTDKVQRMVNKAKILGRRP